MIADDSNCIFLADKSVPDCCLGVQRLSSLIFNSLNASLPLQVLFHLPSMYFEGAIPSRGKVALQPVEVLAELAKTLLSHL